MRWSGYKMHWAACCPDIFVLVLLRWWSKANCKQIAACAWFITALCIEPTPKPQNVLKTWKVMPLLWKDRQVKAILIFKQGEKEEKERPPKQKRTTHFTQHQPTGLPEVFGTCFKVLDMDQWTQLSMARCGEIPFWLRHSTRESEVSGLSQLCFREAVCLDFSRWKHF